MAKILLDRIGTGRRVILCGAMACGLLFGGCAALEHTLGWDVNPQHIELTEQQPGDIPVPDGFRKVIKDRQSNSYDLDPDGFRDAHLIYTGSSPARFVARFYEKTMVMPTFGWKNQSRYQNESDRTLKFTKGRSVCTIVITEIINPVPRTKIEVDIVSTP